MRRGDGQTFQTLELEGGVSGIVYSLMTEKDTMKNVLNIFHGQIQATSSAETSNCWNWSFKWELNVNQACGVSLLSLRGRSAISSECMLLCV